MLPALLLFISIASLAFMLAVAVHRKVSRKQLIAPSHRIFELVERFRFFQGKNLEVFSRLLNANNTAGIEQLIREKFEAQGKLNAKKLTSRLIRHTVPVAGL